MCVRVCFPHSPNTHRSAELGHCRCGSENVYESSFFHDLFIKLISWHQSMLPLPCSASFMPQIVYGVPPDGIGASISIYF